MTLEFEKLTTEVGDMARAAAQLKEAERRQAAAMFARLNESATDWIAIEDALAQAEEQADPKYFRAARPLDNIEPLDARIPPPPPPPQATIIATDGSQILPDRHAPFLYYLVNVGLITYFHGSDQAPEVNSEPRITYQEPGDSDVIINADKATLARDRREIEALAEAAWQYRHEPDGPLLGIVDQRLLYWPFGGGQVEAREAAEHWNAAMTKVRDSGALLAGYIDRPGKQSVMTLLQALDAKSQDDLKVLGKPGQGFYLNDAQLFGRLLKPGERSKVFVDISRTNQDFRDMDPENEVCFFYLNPLRPRGEEEEPETYPLARVDIPLSVARDPAAVAIAHALIIDQCWIYGGYPYALMRADEMAVVGKGDGASLNEMIRLEMMKQGIMGDETLKAQSKADARGGRTRFGTPR